MKNVFAILFCAGMMLTLNACAFPKKSAGVQSGRKYAKVTRVVPHKDANGNSCPLIFLKWRVEEKPEAFFWRADDGWTGCQVTLPANVRPEGEGEMPNPDEIQKNVSLRVMPVYEGKFPMPAQIPATARNTLFFKVYGSEVWYSLPVAVKQ